MTTSQVELNWQAPGPGPWEVEGAHFPRPMPAFALEKVIHNFKRGFAEGTARYGLLLSHFEIGIVNGFWYQQPAAFGAPKGAKGPPPNPILWLLTRLHPKMRARIATSVTAFESRLWREDLRTWDEVDKPRALAAHEALLAVSPAALDDAALIAHLAQCEDHLGEMIYLHHKYTIPCCLPVGDLLAHTAEWTGLPTGEILQLLRGSTPASLGFSVAELRELADAIRRDDTARALVIGSDGAPAQILAALRELGSESGTIAREFLDRAWHRAVSYDIGERASGELPEMLLGTIRSAVLGGLDAKRDESAQRTATLRAQVPQEHQARFDALLMEARAINRLRDERGLYADCWAIGIGRRALLELGRRLCERGLLAAPDHAVDLSMDEARALLLSPGSRPSLDEVRRRAVWRTTKSVSDAPPFLNGKPAAPPQNSILPPAARRAARAIDVFISNLFKESDAASTQTIVRGISVNDGVYEGTARVIDGASDFSRLQQGDVLVTRATAPYFNVVLPLLGAVVTDRGGQLCHAAIVAREYGIPGVVGTREATKLIPDGARVRVDGATGEVHILRGGRGT